MTPEIIVQWCLAIVTVLLTGVLVLSAFAGLWDAVSEILENKR